MSETAIDAWGERAALVIESLLNGELVLSNLAHALPIPEGDSPDARLAALNRAWRRLVEPGETIEDRTRRLHNDVGPPRGERAAESLRKVLQALDGEIGRLVQAGASDPLRPLIRTRDFGVLYLENEPGGKLVYTAGVWDRLPEDHPLRGVLSREQLYHHDGAALLLLGHAFRYIGGQPYSHPHYEQAEAVRLTREWADRQREQRLKAQYEQEAEAAEAERRRQNNPHVRISALEGEVADLRSQIEGGQGEA